MIYRFHPEARQEAIAATQRYKDIDVNLGKDFRTEVDKAISRATSNPQAWPQTVPGIRKCLTNRFPYSLLYHYRREEQEVFIVAVAHTRRKPGYWKQRLS